MWSGSLYLLSRNLNILLRSCPNIECSLISDDRDDRDDGVDGVGGVQMDFGFSFDAVPTMDTVLYFRG